MNNPCHRNCPERASDCHISCESYKAYRKYLDVENAEKRKANDVIYGYNIAKRTRKDIEEFKNPKHYKGGKQ